MKTYCKTFLSSLFLSICLIQINAQAVKDADGNSYNVVKIGTQVWMTENLKTTKLNDGTAISLVPDANLWKTSATPGYCWYNNDATVNKNKYGALYNWLTVGTNKICPKGWHVPADAEWTALTTFLGGEKIAGGKLREKGTAHWQSPNTGATNESGFNALPGGYRNNSGGYANTGFFGFWWASTEYVPTASWATSIGCEGSTVLKLFSLKKNGYSVRCIKDK
jgi:uncharacterized protein (TIGR02145 family)